MPRCPQCGAELSSADAEGLCPQCLILNALESSGSNELGTETGGPATTAAPGEDFGRYRIIELWAKGAWARCIWPSSANPFAGAWRSRS